MTDPMVQLMACPALPRGERLAWFHERHAKFPGIDTASYWRWNARHGLWRFPCMDLVCGFVKRRGRDECHVGSYIAQWVLMARPLRGARERLNAARAEIETLNLKLDEVTPGWMD